MKTTVLRTAMGVADVISSMSRDPSTHVGAVLVRGDMIISTGYNDLVRGMEHKAEYYERPLKYSLIVHAEANCLLNAARTGVSTIGASIVCTHSPCSACCRAALQAGIEMIYYREELDPVRWADDLKIRQLLKIPLRKVGVDGTLL